MQLHEVTQCVSAAGYQTRSLFFFSDPETIKPAPQTHKPADSGAVVGNDARRCSRGEVMPGVSKHKSKKALNAAAFCPVYSFLETSRNLLCEASVALQTSDRGSRCRNPTHLRALTQAKKGAGLAP
jgi:hypothetical protein